MEITNPQRFAVFCTVVVLVIAGLVMWLVPGEKKPEPEPSVRLATPSPNPLVIHLTAKGEEGRAVDITCRAGICQQMAAIAPYQAAATVLVRPRDYLPSPNGRYTAYWLDNIANLEEQLTELWVYDAQTKSTGLVAENIWQPDVREALRWNQSSTHLWFTGNTAAKNQPEKLELIIVSISPPGRSARALPAAEVVDISPAGVRLALADVKISWLRFLDEETQFYATADALGFSIWRRAGSLPKVIGKLSFTQLPAGLTDVKIRLIEPDSSPPEAGVAGAAFDDAELVAFLEHQAGEITGLPEVFVPRIIMTAQANTVYLDYVDAAGVPKRILLTIHDVVHPEWSIRARYERSAGEWRRVAGGSEADPESLRLYEWEVSLKQWILKSSL